MQIDPTMTITNVEPTTPVQARQPGTPTKGQTPGVKHLSHQSAVGNTADPIQADAAVREISQVVEPFNVALKFSKDAETGTIVIQMIDNQSGEELQQIPTKATLHVSATLRKLQGKIFNCKA